MLSFIVSIFEHPSADARTAAVNAMVECYKYDKKVTEGYVDGVKPQIKELLEEKFGALKNEPQVVNIIQNYVFPIILWIFC